MLVPVKRVVFFTFLAWGTVFKTSPEIFAQNLGLIAAIYYWTTGVILFDRLVRWLGGRDKIILKIGVLMLVFWAVAWLVEFASHSHKQCWEGECWEVGADGAHPKPSFCGITECP